MTTTPSKDFAIEKALLKSLNRSIATSKGAATELIAERKNVWKILKAQGVDQKTMAGWSDIDQMVVSRALNEE